jgi:quercetin dioxygenase-like cupin family protein
LDNERVAVYEYVFPAGFRGEEHAAVADEFAYVLEGEFTVMTRGRGKNESKRPARVLVVLLQGKP